MWNIYDGGVDVKTHDNNNIHEMEAGDSKPIEPMSIDDALDWAQRDIGDGYSERAVRALAAELSTIRVERGRLCGLIQHAWIHAGYRNCGYDQMTTEQKSLYNSIKRGEALAPRSQEAGET